VNTKDQCCKQLKDFSILEFKEETLPYKIYENLSIDELTSNGFKNVYNEPYSHKTNI